MAKDLAFAVRTLVEAEEKVEKQRQVILSHLVDNGMHEYFKVDWNKIRKIYYDRQERKIAGYNDTPA